MTDGRAKRVIARHYRLIAIVKKTELHSKACIREGGKEKIKHRNVSGDLKTCEEVYRFTERLNNNLDSKI